MNTTHTHTHAHTHTHTQARRQTDRQTDRQTHKHTEAIGMKRSFIRACRRAFSRTFVFFLKNTDTGPARCKRVSVYRV